MVSVTFLGQDEAAPSAASLEEQLQEQAKVPRHFGVSRVAIQRLKSVQGGDNEVAEGWATSWWWRRRGFQMISRCLCLDPNISNVNGFQAHRQQLWRSGHARFLESALARTGAAPGLANTFWFGWSRFRRTPRGAGLKSKMHLRSLKITSRSCNGELRAFTRTCRCCTASWAMLGTHLACCWWERFAWVFFRRPGEASRA